MIAPLPRLVRPLPLALLAAVLTLLATAPARAFVLANNGSNPSVVRWTQTAAGPVGATGSPLRLTWSFVPDGTSVAHPNYHTDASKRRPSELIARLDATFGAGAGGTDLTQRPWFHIFEEAFDRWSELSGVTYTYEPNDSGVTHGGVAGALGVRGDVRIGGIGMGLYDEEEDKWLNGVGGALAYNFFATGGGDMAIDTDDLAGLLANPANNYRALRNTIMHEAGHGLGLNHTQTGSANFLMGESLGVSYDGPQHDDLRGIHWLYGDRFEKAPAGRNETAALATPLGLLEVGSSLAIGTSGSGTAIAAGETDFVSISNENDVDFFSFTIDAPSRLTMSMTPRGATYTQGATNFNTTTTNNLSLALFASDGVTLLTQASSGAAGVVESITDFVLYQAGTYFARVRGPVSPTNQVVQFYQLDLSATALLPALLGDFNGDGLVDAADYTVWRDNEGSTVAAYTSADHTGDGFVDAADYTLWQTHYGASLSSLAVAVPEPTALVLAVLALCAPRRR